MTGCYFSVDPVFVVVRKFDFEIRYTGFEKKKTEQPINPFPHNDTF